MVLKIKVIHPWSRILVLVRKYIRTLILFPQWFYLLLSPFLQNLKPIPSQYVRATKRLPSAK